jgi:ribonuclease HI
MKIITATFDGACEPYNPCGHLGLGWTIDDQHHHRYIPAAYANTNNVAEYFAVIEILRWAEGQTEPATLNITGDSQIVIYQIDGSHAVRAGSLRAYHAEATSLLHQLRDDGWVVTLRWVPRERNEVADRLSMLALTENGVTPTQRAPSAGYTDRLGDIADAVGLSAIAVGKVLTRLGLRDASTASGSAIEQALAVTRFNGFGISTDWHLNRVADLIRANAQEEIGRATRAKEKAKVKADAEAAMKRAEASECSRIEEMGRRIRLHIEAHGGTLIEMVEDSVEEVADRPKVYAERRSWWSQRIGGKRGTRTPEAAMEVQAINQSIEKEYAHLLRRAAA